MPRSGRYWPEDRTSSTTPRAPGHSSAQGITAMRRTTVAGGSQRTEHHERDPHRGHEAEHAEPDRQGAPAEARDRDGDDPYAQQQHPALDAAVGGEDDDGRRRRDARGSVDLTHVLERAAARAEHSGDHEQGPGQDPDRLSGAQRHRRHRGHLPLVPGEHVRGTDHGGDEGEPHDEIRGSGDRPHERMVRHEPRGARCIIGIEPTGHCDRLHRECPHCSDREDDRRPARESRGAHAHMVFPRVPAVSGSIGTLPVCPPPAVAAWSTMTRATAPCPPTRPMPLCEGHLAAAAEWADRAYGVMDCCRHGVACAARPSACAARPAGSAPCANGATARFPTTISPRPASTSCTTCALATA